jgi:predicted RNase H-like nuclease (RuvC/YqgF family)
VEIPELALSIGGGLGAVIATVVVILNRNATTHKAEPQKMEVTEHDCIRKADIEGIKTRLAEGSITFERLRTENEHLKREIREQSELIREVSAIVHRTLGRLDQ